MIRPIPQHQADRSPLAVVDEPSTNETYFASSPLGFNASRYQVGALVRIGQPASAEPFDRIFNEENIVAALLLLQGPGGLKPASRGPVDEVPVRVQRL
jgi:hypothetical protein